MPAPSGGPAITTSAKRRFLANRCPRSRRKRTVNDEMIAEYERQFQDHYYSFEHEDCLFVVINGMIVNSGLDCETRQREWLEALLAANPGPADLHVLALSALSVGCGRARPL